MKWVTETADIKCGHHGKAVVGSSQNLVRVDGKKILVSRDPVGKAIVLCPNYNVVAGMKPCTSTLVVTQGYSDFISINGNPVCLDILTGLTDGTPPGAVYYSVHNPGQSLLEEI